MQEKPVARYSKDHFVEQLTRASIAYLRTGLTLFHGPGKSDAGARQAAVGNIAIAIELMSKCFLADKSLSLVLKGDSYASRAYDLVPETSRQRGQFHKLTFELVTGRASMRELDEILNAMRDFLPDSASELSYVLKNNLGLYRNAAVHAAYHARNVHQVELAAWAGLRLIQIFDEVGFHRVAHLYELTADDMGFLAAFEAERAEMFEAKIARARQAADSVNPVSVIIQDALTELEGQCPVCGHNALLSGTVRAEMRMVFDGHDVDEEFAYTFAAERLECPSCKLELSDPWEMERQAVALTHDVTARLEEYASRANVDLLQELGLYEEDSYWAAPDYDDWEPEEYEDSDDQDDEGEAEPQDWMAYEPSYDDDECA